MSSQTGKVYGSSVIGQITVIDGQTNQPHILSFGNIGQIQGLAVNPNTNRIFAANTSFNKVLIIDSATETLAATVNSGSSPWVVAVNTVTNKAYVTNLGDNNVTVIDGATLGTTTVPVGTSPLAIAVNESLNKVYVGGNNNVTVIDGATNAVTNLPTIGPVTGIAINTSTNKVYVADTGLLVIDGITNTSSRITVPFYSWAVAVNPSTNRIYLAHALNDTFTMVDGATGTVTSSTLSSRPIALTVNPATNRVFVSLETSQAVAVIDGSTGSELARLAGGNRGDAIAFNSANSKVYVANFLSSDVTVIAPAAVATTTTLQSSVNPAITFGPMTFTATVNGSTPTGTVSFTLAGAPIAGCTAVALNAGSAQCAYPGFSTPGGYSVAASYSGDTANIASVGMLTQSVTIPPPVGTTTNLQSSMNPTVTFAPVTLTATVTGSAPTGTVSFTIAAVPIAACTAVPLAAGSAQCAYSGFNAPGGYSIAAAYSGDAANNPSAGVLTQTVTAPPPGASVTSLQSSANPVSVLAPVTFKATVSGSAPTGTVSFTIAGSPIPACMALPLNGISAQCTYPGFSTPGSYSIAASYSGDSGNAPSNGALTQTVVILGPSAPRNLACTAGPGGAHCTFDAPLQNNGSLITKYTLECSSNPGTNLTVIEFNNLFTDIRLTQLGVLYYCTVSAYNGGGKGSPSNLATVVPFSSTAVRGGIDSNGDGKAEVIVRTANGSFLASLNAQNQLVFLPSIDPGPASDMLGAGALLNPHRSDLLLRDSFTGVVKVWAGFQGPPDSEYLLRTVKPGWVVTAITDIDGDGQADIVWRYLGSPLNPPANPDDVGVVFVWFMGGTQVSEVKQRGGAPLGWQFGGAADLHGNGRSDLVWVSPAGAVRAITSLAGRNFANELIGTQPAGYTLQRVADFSGDGKGDLLFRNAAGKTKLWVMNGTEIDRVLDLPDADPGWTLFAAGDLNGDGCVDMVWKKPDNTLAVWLMNASALSSPTVINFAGTAPAGAAAISN